MSDVSKELVRIFFELNGFSVKNGTYLLVNRIQSARTHPDSFLLSVDNLNKVKQAVVDVKGWHTEVFFPSVINSSPEIFRFLEEDSLKEGEKFFGAKNFRKIIVVSRLPNVKETLKKSLALMKQEGIDHVIEFSVILNYLVNQVMPNVNYMDNDLLQVIRIFKCHNFYRPPQLELFESLKKIGVKEKV